MADEFGAATNRINESPTKTNESGPFTNQSSLPGSPRADDDAKSDEIEREKTLSPSLEIAEECIESFIHQGLENADNEHGNPAPNLSNTYRCDLEIQNPLSVGTYNKKEGIDQTRFQQNILENIELQDSEEQDFKEEASNIIMEAKNIINTCLLDAGNLDDRLSIDADDDNIDNSEKEVNEIEKEKDFEENAGRNIEGRFTATNENYERTYSESKVNNVESNIENSEKSIDRKGHSASDDDGVNSAEEDNNGGKKDKKKHKHHKKHAKKKKKRHKKGKAEKTKEKDSKVPEVDDDTGDESLKDQVFGMNTNLPSSSTSTKPVDHSLEPKSPLKRKLASIVTCVSSSNMSTMSGKDELESMLQGHRLTSKDDNPERWSTERSSKSTESIKEDPKEKLHRKLSSTSKSSETQDQTEDDNIDYHSDKPPSEKHKSKSKKKHRNKSHDEEHSNTKEKEKPKRSESSESREMKLSRQRSYESSKRSSQSEHRRSKSSRSRSWESEEHQVSRDWFSGSGQQQSGSKSKERSCRRHRSTSKHRQTRSRSRSKSMETISRYGHKSGRTSNDGQMMEERSRDGERSRSDRERSRSRSVEKHYKQKRDSEQSRKMSVDESSRSDMDSSEFSKDSKRQKHNKTLAEWSQKSPSRKCASKERAPISIESNASPRKRASSRSTSRERSPEKRARVATEVLGRTDLSEDYIVSSLATTMDEDKPSSKDNLARETDQRLNDAFFLNDERKAESKEKEHVDRESKEEDSDKVESRRDTEDERNEIESQDILESEQICDSSTWKNEKDRISNNTFGEFKTFGEELYTAKKENVDFLLSSNTKFCNEKSSVGPENKTHEKAKDGDYSMESDQKPVSISLGQISDENTSIVNNEPVNQASAGISNNKFGIPLPQLPPPPPPPHVLMQNEPVISNLPGGPPMDNAIDPLMVNPYLRTFPDSGILIHQQPHSVSQCSFPQLQFANQNAFSQPDMTSVENVLPQEFTLGTNQEPLKDNTSAHLSCTEQSSLLGLPSSASAIPFLGDEGPKILPKKKKEALNNGDKSDVSHDHNHATVSAPSPVDMDMSSPEDIIEKMNEEFWENERKGTERNVHSVPKKKDHKTQYDSSTQNTLDGEEDYDPEHFVSCTSPKMKKKKDKTRKHSDSKSKFKVQSVLDKLHRQARVEEEVKIVLKDYYKHREINKDEYKDILRKAVPQVANSDHSIDPERIRSLVKKYVAKTKGQRLRKPNN